jgi:hypothetical protein
MPWTYQQGTGLLTDPFGQPFARGYSGTGLGRNNPAMESVKNVGPIPRGLYRIGKAYTHLHLGRVCMNLEPEPETDTHDRTDFRIHANNASTNDASHGCVVLDLPYRLTVSVSKDEFLRVVE